MRWPLSQDYNEAIQSPRSNFNDPDLQKGKAVTNPLGIPLPRSGNFADVYELRCPGSDRWAVKCFTREVPGLRERYDAITRHLALTQLPFIVDFTFLEQGIRVCGRWFPVLKMQWVEGLTLNEFVRRYADKPSMLHSLLQVWVRMAARLRQAGIAHADLQHGNILLVPGQAANALALKLVDYDGMFVPALDGSASGEVGHPCYQHPQRFAERTYSQEVDRFPLLLIATALNCLKVGGQKLWEKYDNGDNLLFSETDLRVPVKSPLFYDLLKLSDPQALRLVREMLDALKGQLELVPLLEEVLPELHPAAPLKPSATTTQTKSPRVVKLLATQSEVEQRPEYEEAWRKDKRNLKKLQPSAEPPPAAREIWWGETHNRVASHLVAEPQSTVELVAANSASPGDFNDEDNPSLLWRRKGSLPLWLWGGAATGMAALVLIGCVLAFSNGDKTKKSKGETKSPDPHVARNHKGGSRDRPRTGDDPDHSQGQSPIMEETNPKQVEGEQSPNVSDFSGTRQLIEEKKPESSQGEPQKKEEEKPGQLDGGWEIEDIPVPPVIPPTKELDDNVLPLGIDGKPLNLDFETGTLKDWTAEGEAFHGQPIKGDKVAGRRADMKSRHQGDYWIGGFEHKGDRPQGTLTSVSFKVTHPWASFLVGGGLGSATCVELILKDTDKSLSSISGNQKEDLQRVSIDLRPYLGKEIFVRLVDRDSGGWGHLNFDDFRFHNRNPNNKVVLNPAPSSTGPVQTNRPLDARDAAAEAYEKSCSAARMALLKAFDRVVKELAASTERRRKLIDIVKEERNRFETSNLIPWSEPMRRDVAPYLSTLKTAQQKLRSDYQKLVNMQRRAKGESMAAELEAELKARLGIHVMAKWQHSRNGQMLSIYQLWSNGSLINSDGNATWNYDKGSLLYTFPGVGIRNILKISDDGKTYSGSNDKPDRPQLTGAYVP